MLPLCCDFRKDHSVLDDQPADSSLEKTIYPALSFLLLYVVLCLHLGPMSFPTTIFYNYQYYPYSSIVKVAVLDFIGFYKTKPHRKHAIALVSCNLSAISSKMIPESQIQELFCRCIRSHVITYFLHFDRLWISVMVFI